MESIAEMSENLRASAKISIKLAGLLDSVSMQIAELEDTHKRLKAVCESQMKDPRVKEYYEKYPEFTRTNVGPED